MSDNKYRVVTVGALLKTLRHLLDEQVITLDFGVIIPGIVIPTSATKDRDSMLTRNFIVSVLDKSKDIALMPQDD